jgi:hypothetical protein
MIILAMEASLLGRTNGNFIHIEFSFQMKVSFLYPISGCGKKFFFNTHRAGVTLLLIEVLVFARPELNFNVVPCSVWGLSPHVAFST